MMQIVLIGLGAGAASALLFASVASGSPLSVALANFAQLPILLAAIGWTHLAGLFAALLASAGLAVVSSGSVALAFLLGIGLPAWWLGYLALLARPLRFRSGGRRMVSGRPIVVWTAIAAAIRRSRHACCASALTPRKSNAGLRRELERALRFLAGPQQIRRCSFPASGIRSACSTSWC